MARDGEGKGYAGAAAGAGAAAAGLGAGGYFLNKARNEAAERAKKARFRSRAGKAGGAIAGLAALSGVASKAFRSKTGVSPRTYLKQKQIQKRLAQEGQKRTRPSSAIGPGKDVLEWRKKNPIQKVSSEDARSAAIAAGGVGALGLGGLGAAHLIKQQRAAAQRAASRKALGRAGIGGAAVAGIAGLGALAKGLARRGADTGSQFAKGTAKRTKKFRGALDMLPGKVQGGSSKGGLLSKIPTPGGGGPKPGRKKPRFTPGGGQRTPKGPGFGFGTSSIPGLPPRTPPKASPDATADFFNMSENRRKAAKFFGFDPKGGSVGDSAIRRKHRQMARGAHPDRGGDAGRMSEINKMYAMFKGGQDAVKMAAFANEMVRILEV